MTGYGHTSTVAKLSDAFNPQNVLMIEDVVAHDMWVLTRDQNNHEFVAATRVSNFIGSGKASFMHLHTYLGSLRKNYGQALEAEVPSQLATQQQPDLSSGAKQISIFGDEGITGKTYLRVISAADYFGFQSYCVNEEFEPFNKAGPIVWVDKRLPKTVKQVKALNKVFDSAELEPFVPEVA